VNAGNSVIEQLDPAAVCGRVFRLLSETESLPRPPPCVDGSECAEALFAALLHLFFFVPKRKTGRYSAGFLIF